MISASFWEQKLIGNLKGKAFKGSSNFQTEKKIVTKVIDEQQKLLSYLKKNMELWSLRIELLDFYRFEGVGLTKSIKTLKSEVVACVKSKPNNQDHLEFIIQEHTIASLINYFDGNLNAAVKNQRKLILLLEKESDYIENNLNNYASEINNYLAMSFAANSSEDIQKWIEILMELLSKSNVRSNAYLNSRIFSFYLVNALRFHNRNEEYNKSIEIFQEDQFNKFQDKMNPYKQFQIRYNLVLSYFYFGDYRTSLQWINKIINSNIEIRLNELSFIRCLSYVIHYQLGNLSIIESLYNSKDKNTLKKLKANRLEYLLLKGLYMMCMDPDNRKKIKSKFVDQLSEIVLEKSINILVLIRYLKEIL